MSHFKINDEVWFFYTQYGRTAWGDDATLIYPQEVEIVTGNIVNFNDKRDCVHIYVKDCEKIVEIGWTFFDEWVYETKQEAVDAMIKRMQDME